VVVVVGGKINSPAAAAAPALSQGLGGETDAILGIKLASGTSPGRGRMGEMELGLGVGRVEVDRGEDGGEGKGRIGEVSQGACGREWRSRGCRRLPTGEVIFTPVLCEEEV
jgi:hypothetical protein